MNNPVQPLMRSLHRNLPDIPLDLVSEVLVSEYGLEGDLTPFESERDQNIRVGTRDANYLIKVCNADDEPQVVDLQIQALKHIERVDPSVPVPRALPTLNDIDATHVVGPQGSTHIVRLMSYIDGVVADRHEYDTAEFRHNTGSTLARLDRSLRGFFHPAVNHDHPWTLMGVPRLLDQVDYIEDESARRNIVTILERVRDITIPACLGLRHQAIHQDAHTSNLVLDPENPKTVAGIIDFGDINFGPLIAEVAVAAYLSGRPDGNPQTLIDIVMGYDSITRLEAAEIDALYDLVLARLAMSTSIAAARAALFPDESRYGPNQPFMWDRIEVALEAAPVITDELRRLLGLPRRNRSDLGAQRVAALGRHSPHFYKKTLHVVAAEGMWMEGDDGKKYLDFYNNVPTVGHNHPQVVNAVSRQLATLNTNTRYLYPSVVEYSERLTATLDYGLDVCLFVNSGSEANDVASQILKHRSATERLLVMEGSYHGMTEASLAIAGEEDSIGPNVITIDLESNSDSVPESLSGFFVDPALTSNGVPNTPRGFFSTIADAVRSKGGLVVADEVQSGFGRTGVMWGHERKEFIPDVVTMGKPVGNGVPLGVVVTRREILDHFMEDTGLFSTFGGNPVSIAAGLAVLDVIERQHLVENSRVVGQYLKDSLETLARSGQSIREVRGTGLLVGLDLDMSGDETRQLIELMRKAGVLVGVAGRNRNVLKLRPPLVAQPEHVDRLIDALQASLALL